MSIIQIKLWCPNCGSDEVLSEYNEKENNIICICKKCKHEDLLSKFDYLIVQ